MHTEDNDLVPASWGELEDGQTLTDSYIHYIVAC